MKYLISEETIKRWIYNEKDEEGNYFDYGLIENEILKILDDEEVLEYINTRFYNPHCVEVKNYLLKKLQEKNFIDKSLNCEIFKQRNFNVMSVLKIYYAMKLFASGKGMNSYVLYQLTHTSDLYIEDLSEELQQKIIEQLTDEDIKAIEESSNILRMIQPLLKYNKYIRDKVYDYLNNDFESEYFDSNDEYTSGEIFREIFEANDKTFKELIFTKISSGNTKFLNIVLNMITRNNGRFVIEKESINYILNLIISNKLLKSEKIKEGLLPENKIYFNELNFKYLQYYYTNFPNIRAQDIIVEDMLLPTVCDIIDFYRVNWPYNDINLYIDEYEKLIVEYNEKCDKLSENKYSYFSYFSDNMQKNYLEDILKNKKYLDSSIKGALRHCLGEVEDYKRLIEEYIKFLEDKEKVAIFILKNDKLDSISKALIATAGFIKFIKRPKFYEGNYHLLEKHDIFDFIDCSNLLTYSNLCTKSLIREKFGSIISKFTKDNKTNEVYEFFKHEFEKINKTNKCYWTIKYSDKKLVLPVIYAESLGFEMPELIKGIIHKEYFKKGYETEVLLDYLFDFSVGNEEVDEDSVKRILKILQDSNDISLKVYEHLHLNKKEFQKLLNIKFTERQRRGISFSTFHKTGLITQDELFDLLVSTINSKNIYAKENRVEVFGVLDEEKKVEFVRLIIKKNKKVSAENLLILLENYIEVASEVIEDILAIIDFDKTTITMKKVLVDKISNNVYKEKVSANLYERLDNYLNEIKNDGIEIFVNNPKKLEENLEFTKNDENKNKIIKEMILVLYSFFENDCINISYGNVDLSADGAIELYNEVLESIYSIFVKYDIGDYTKYSIFSHYLMNGKLDETTEENIFENCPNKESLDFSFDKLLKVNVDTYSEYKSKIPIILEDMFDYAFAIKKMFVVPNLQHIIDCEVSDNMFKIYMSFLSKQEDLKFRFYGYNIEYLYYSKLVIEKKIDMEDLFNFLKDLSENTYGFSTKGFIDFNLLSNKTEEDICNNQILKVNLELNNRVAKALISDLNTNSDILGPSYSTDKLIYGFENLKMLVNATKLSDSAEDVWIFDYIREFSPLKKESYENFLEMIKDTKITKDELIYLCFINESIISYASKYLNNTMLESIIYFFKFHDREYTEFYDKYTNFELEDVDDGVIDQVWFNTIKNSIGMKEFMHIKDLKKKGGASLIFDVLNNKVSKREIIQNIKEKKNKKKYLKAYSLIKPGKNYKNDIASRIRVFRDYLESIKTSNSQTKYKNKIFINNLINNMSYTFGFENEIVFALYLFEAEYEKNKKYFEWVKIQDVEVKLVFEDNLIKARYLVEGEIKTRKPVRLKNSADKFLSIKDDMNEALKRFKDRFEMVMVFQTSFELKAIKCYFKNPVIKMFLSNLIYSDRNNNFYILKDEKFLDENLKEVRIDDEESLFIVHSQKLIHEDKYFIWKEIVIKNKIVQPFKQLFRETYFKRDDELELVSTSRYAGSPIDVQLAFGLLKKRGWKVKYDQVYKTYSDKRLRIELWGYSWSIYSDGESIELVKFFDLKTNKEILIKDVDEVVFSEIMRDLDVVVSVAYVGDMESSIGLSTLEIRQEILKINIDLYNLKNVTVQKHKAFIEGYYGKYEVNLKSGIAKKEGKGTLLLFPIMNKKGYDVYLPFVDKNGKTQEVISVILLLAQDKEITMKSVLNEVIK